MTWDTIVVGAGIEGSAAAYSLAKRGRTTLLLEQFPLPHSRGSSHGHSRITRMAYAQPFYSSMMIDSFRIWQQLQRETGQNLYIKTGLVVVEKTDSQELQDYANSLSGSGAEYEMLSAQRLRAKYPCFAFDDSFSAVFDPSAGILRADKCLAAFQNEFVKLGGVIHDGEPVRRLLSDDNITTVTTSKSSYQARTVILAAGPWTSRLTESEPLGLSLPLDVLRTTVCYWQRRTADAYGSLDDPCFVKCTGSNPHVYALPALEYPQLVKVCWNSGVKCDPDSRDAVPPASQQLAVKLAQDVVRHHLPGVDSTAPSILETCMYTMTPDGNFIIDFHPKWKNVIIAAGFSGHGFKLSAVVGRILADLATSGRTNYDISHFAISRFTARKPVASKL